MVSEKVAKILVLVVNYFLLVFFGILSILFCIYIEEQSELLKVLGKSISACLVAMAGCYGVHKSNTCMLTMNGIYNIISSCIGLILGIVLLVGLPSVTKLYSLIVFAWVAVEVGLPSVTKLYSLIVFAWVAVEVGLPSVTKLYSLIVFAWVAVEMAGGILAIHLSKCIKIKRYDKQEVILITKDCTRA